MNEPVHIVIRKPIYGYTCAIRDKYLNEAIRDGQKILLTVADRTELIDPEEWKRTGTRMEKVFKIPERPMILYQNTLPYKP